MPVPRGPFEVVPGGLRVALKVVPKAELPDGEYCFYYGGTAPGIGIFAGAGGAVKVFDFGVSG